MAESPLEFAAMALAGIALAGWLLVSLVSAAARVRSGRPQSYRMPWWAVAALGIAVLLAIPSFPEWFMIVIGLVLLAFGFIAGTTVRFSPLGEYRWWNADAPVELAPADIKTRAAALNSPALVALAERVDPPRTVPAPAPDAASDPSEYDGHANYVEEARKEATAGALAPLVKDNLDVSPFIWSALSKLQMVVAFGVMLLVGRWAVLWARATFQGELGFGGIVILLGVLIIAALGAGLFLGVAAIVTRLWPRWQTVVIYNVVAVLFIWVGFVQPVLLR